VGSVLATARAQVDGWTTILGFTLVAWMYNRNRKEGIDPNAVFTQIPPA
jgi:hypothetical protein